LSVNGRLLTTFSSEFKLFPSLKLNPALSEGLFFVDSEAVHSFDCRRSHKVKIGTGARALAFSFMVAGSGAAKAEDAQSSTPAPQVLCLEHAFASHFQKGLADPVVDDEKTVVSFASGDPNNHALLITGEVYNRDTEDGAHKKGDTIIFVGLLGEEGEVAATYPAPGQSNGFRIYRTKGSPAIVGQLTKTVAEIVGWLKECKRSKPSASLAHAHYIS
jgi:hypothetical protein